MKKKKLSGKLRQHLREDCTTKVSYKYKYQAEGAVKAMLKKHIPDFEAYLCPYCGMYHVGRNYKFINLTFWNNLAKKI